MHEDPQLLQKVVGCARCGGSAADDRLNVLPCHFPDETVSDVLVSQEAKDDIAVGALGLWCQSLVVRTYEVLVHQMMEAAWNLRLPLNWGFAVFEGELVGLLELQGSWRSG